MKFIALVFLFFSFVSASLLVKEYTGYTFEDFEVEYKKVYQSEAERNAHKFQFHQNLHVIAHHNRNPHKTYTLGVTAFADLSREQMKRYLGYNKNMRMGHRHEHVLQYVKEKMPQIPPNVDWRTKGAVSPVKNQGACGSCWAFSATESIESYLFINTQKMLILSPQNVLECAANPNDCGGTGGCGGSIPELAFDWAKDGIALESTVPYRGMNAPCVANVTKAAKTHGFVKLPANNPDAMLATLASTGPLSVNVDASTWHLYTGGIYNGCVGPNLDINHVVQAVGYGVDSNNNQYWLVRNSWGTSWGESGYIRLYRGPLETCYVDNTPGDGTACKNETQPQHVCGTCGIWFDTSYPTQVQLF